jgi:hypothetical protein
MKQYNGQGLTRGYKLSVIIGEYECGNSERLLSYYGINPDRNTEEPKLSLANFDKMRELIKEKAYQCLLEEERLVRLNSADFTNFCKTFYGHNRFSMKWGTGICSTTLALLNSTYMDWHNLRIQYALDAKNLANAVTSTKVLRHAAKLSGMLPILTLLDPAIHPLNTNKGLTPDILRTLLETSGNGLYHYMPSTDIAVVSWEILEAMLTSKNRPLRSQHIGIGLYKGHVI